MILAEVQITWKVQYQNVFILNLNLEGWDRCSP